MACTLSVDNFWLEKSRFNNAEKSYYENLSKRKAMDTANFETVNVKEKECNSMDNSISSNKNAVPIAKEPNTKPTKAKKSKKSKSANNQANAQQQQSKPAAAVAAVAAVTAATAATAAANNAEQVIIESNPKVQADVTESKDVPKNQKKIRNGKKATNAAKAKGTVSNNQCTLVSEIAKAREHIKNSLEKMDGIATLAASPVSTDVAERICSVERENQELRKMIENLKNICLDSQKRITSLESQLNASKSVTVQQAPVQTKNAAKQVSNNIKSNTDVAAAANDDDDVDLFGSDDDEESTEAARIREERLAAYEAKKSKKPALIAKSSILLDVKPWDDETDLKAMEVEIRQITTDGLLWGASKFVPVAFGIQKLSISCVVEDDKVSIDWLTEEIEKLEDYVQSVDIAAFNKI